MGTRPTWQTARDDWYAVESAPGAAAVVVGGAASEPDGAGPEPGAESATDGSPGEPGPAPVATSAFTAYLEDPEPGVPPVPAPRTRRRVAVAALAAAGLLAVVGGAVTVVTVGGTAGADRQEVVAESGSGATATVPGSDGLWCADLAPGAPATRDSPDRGAAAIAGFEDAYYGARDGSKARTFVAEDARVGGAEALTRGIAELIPVGTTHCVVARRTAPGEYAVDLFERRPDGTTTQYRQSITTVAEVGSPTGEVITAISKREG
ncbi:hypothetical protein [Rhodococcus kronopolitis]|uniref:DUF8176 domain-containing protein n=1 Tax=Rhodococcus kronopolitis TaxID=1460226 RepID=A0ABV9FV54_9NOCA